MSVNSLLDMFKEVKEKVIGPYKRAARIFVRQTKRDVQENASWQAVSAEGQLEWEDNARDNRSLLQPMLFEYAERRSKGIEPPPGRHTWPRGEKQAKVDREAIELEARRPPSGMDWKEVEWNKGITQLEGMRSHLMHLRDPKSSKRLGIIQTIDEQQKLPKAKITVPPEKIQMGRTDPFAFHVETLGHDQLIEIPPGFRLHPNRPWTQIDVENLYHLIEEGTSDIAISEHLQRTEEQWHHMYQYMANIQVHEPRCGNWSPEQDAMLVRFIEEYEMIDWDRIAFHLGTTVAEARQYWVSRSSIRTPPPSEKKQPAAEEGTPATGALSQVPDDMPGNGKVQAFLDALTPPPSDSSESVDPFAEASPTTQPSTVESEKAVKVQDVPRNATVGSSESPKESAGKLKRTRESAAFEEAEVDHQHRQPKLRRLSFPATSSQSAKAQGHAMVVASEPPKKAAGKLKRTQESAELDEVEVEVDNQQQEPELRRLSCSKTAPSSQPAKVQGNATILPSESQPKPAENRKRTHKSVELDDKVESHQQPKLKSRRLGDSKRATSSRPAKACSAPPQPEGCLRAAKGRESSDDGPVASVIIEHGRKRSRETDSEDEEAPRKRHWTKVGRMSRSRRS